MTEVRRALLPAALLATALAVAPGSLRAGGDDAPPPAGEGGGAGERTVGPKLALIVDYLPAFLYGGERLAFSLRVERRPGLEEAVPFRLAWHFEGEDAERPISPGSKDCRAEERFTVVRDFLKVPKGARRFRFELTAQGERLAAGSALFLDESSDWPKGARAAWGGMVTADGEPLILTLQERVAQVDDRVRPLQWIWRQGQSGAQSVLVAGPPLCAAGAKGYGKLLEGSAEQFKFVELPATATDASGGSGRAQGIYRLVELVEAGLGAGAGKEDLVVLVAPADDPETATEPRRYRQGLDWVLARLARAGAKRVALIPPLTRQVPAKQTAAYAEICREACRVYEQHSGARFLDAGGLSDPELWKPEGAVGQTTGRWPNARGQEALAELIRGAYK